MSEIQIVDLREIFLSNSSFGPREIEEIKNENIQVLKYKINEYREFVSNKDFTYNLHELLRYIKVLKPHYQAVINLRYFHEMSYNDISESLGEPLNNVKVRLLRARKLLAEIITQNSKI